jgi:hypothetical protein
VNSYKTIFDAIFSKLNTETRQRSKRTLDEWILAERECVKREINLQRRLLAYEPVGIAEVERAELQALGHSDYIAKYAHAAADLVLRKEAW